jgi:hypothetical protein
VWRVRIELGALAFLAAACLAGFEAAPVHAGPPAFGTYQPILVSPPGDLGSQRVHVADVNGDGKADLLATRLRTDNKGLLVFLSTTPAGAATPTFAGPTPFDTGAQTMLSTLADINTDGRPDVVMTTATGFSVVLNTTPAGAATPSFGAATLINGLTPFASLFVGGQIFTPDLNGDGRPDLVFADVSGHLAQGQIGVLLSTTPSGSSSPTFSAATYLDPAIKNLGGFSTGDVNGDGKPDILIADQTQDDALGTSMLMNTTPANATVPSFTQLDNVFPETGLSTVAIDVNGDGRPDFGTGVGLGIAWRINTTPAGTATPTFGPSTTFPLTATGQAQEIHPADFNGDGKTDIFSGDPSFAEFFPGHSLQVNTTPTGAASAAFATPLHIVSPAGLDQSAWAAVGDFDGDGKPDVAQTGNIENPDPAGPQTPVEAIQAYMNVSRPIPQPASDSVIFAPQRQGTTSAAQVDTVTDTGGWTMSASRTLTGDTGDFAVTSDTCSSVDVVVEATCTLQFTFTPQASGERKATLTINPGHGGEPRQVVLYGTGAAQQATLDTIAPTCKLSGVRGRYKAAAFIKKGIRATVACNEASSLIAQLVVRVKSISGKAKTARVGDLVLSEKTSRLGGGKRKVTLKPSKKLTRRLGKKFKVTLVIAATDASKNTAKVTKSIRVK